MANKISVIIDVVADRATQSLKSFRQSINDADGAAGKFKAGASGALDSITANAGNLAMAGGAALFAFGAKAVGEFQRVALEAGRMSESLGIPVDAMSRLIEVSGDLGIESGTLEKSLGKMNQTAGKSPQAFDDIGAAIARNADGSMNVNQTFLNTVDALNRIPDAGRRAAAAQQIFGKGWRDMAELIGQGSDTIIESMEGVSEAQAISPEEVQKARDYKAAMENLKDALGMVTLAAGEALTPALTTIANAIGVITDAVMELEDKTGVSLFDGLFSADFWKFGPVWDNGPGAILKEITGFEGEKPAAEIAKVGESFDGVSADVEETGEEYKWWAQDMRSESQRTADKLTGDWDRITGKISDEQAFLQAKGEFDALREAAVTAWEEGEAGVDAYRLAQLNAQAAVAEYIKEVDNIPPQKATDILALIDQNRLDEAEALLADLSKDRTANLYLNVKTNSVGDIIGRVSGARASGGPVSAGGAYLVGEEGPELLQMGSQSGKIIPNGAIVGGGTSTGGATYNFTINNATDPDAVVRAIRQHVKRNGPIQGIT